MSTNSGWIHVDTRRPKLSRAERKPGALGQQVLIYPPVKEPGSADQHVGFYGCRISDEPGFYLHGRAIDVEWWQPLPEAPNPKSDWASGPGPLPTLLWWNRSGYGYRGRIPVTLIRLSYSGKRAYIRLISESGTPYYVYVPLDKLEPREDDASAPSAEGESS